MDPSTVTESKTDNWPTSSRGLEADLPAGAYERYVTCAASAQPVGLRSAYCASWMWSLELFERVAAPLGVVLPPTVIERVGRLLDEAPVRWSTR